MELTLKLPGDMRAPETARRALSCLQMRLPEPAYDAAVLLVGELVTNALLHASMDGGEIRLDVELDRRMLRAEVRDEGPGFTPPEPNDDPEADAGRGLLLLNEIADEWGTQADPNTCVWFELRERWWE